MTVCGPVPLRARVLPNALPGPNVVGAVREGFLEASSVCLLVVAVDALEHNLNSGRLQITIAMVSIFHFCYIKFITEFRLPLTIEKAYRGITLTPEGGVVPKSGFKAKC